LPFCVNAKGINLKGDLNMKLVVVAALLALSFTTGFTCSKNTPAETAPAAQEQMAAPAETAPPATEAPAADAPAATPAAETK
jgi:hypothetical protein